MSDKILIERLGHQGDGIAVVDNKPVYVAGALPGEVVVADGKGTKRSLERIVSVSAERVEPFCRYFGSCGGCQVQHLAANPYRKWKQELLVAAFQQAGLSAQFHQLIEFPRRNRRRAIFTALRIGKRQVFGFSERQSNRITDIFECPVLVSELETVIPEMRRLGEIAANGRKPVRLHAVACFNGIDLNLETPFEISERTLLSLTAAQESEKFIRISVNGEPAIVRETPYLLAGEARLTPPPGSFVQASDGAEQVMADLVMGHLSECSAIVDLFSGFGPFALRLAQNSIVHAVEADAVTLSALNTAWRSTGGKLKQVTAERRDLFRSPLSAKELQRFDGAVFDPPRAGAEAQSRQLAISGIERIAAVSCNPATLARDCRILCDAGYRIASIHPIDQFAHTGHLEAVALLEKAA